MRRAGDLALLEQLAVARAAADDEAGLADAREDRIAGRALEKLVDLRIRSLETRDGLHHIGVDLGALGGGVFFLLLRQGEAGQQGESENDRQKLGEQDFAHKQSP